MRIFAKKGKPALCVSVFLALFLMFSAQAGAENGSGSLDVIKRWEGDSPLPESVTLYLQREGATMASLRLSKADDDGSGSWKGSFENVPLYDEAGLPIPYSVVEKPVEGWSFSLLQSPQAPSLRVGSWGEKVTPASSSSYPVGGANLLAANKGGSYYVWTREPLDENSRLMLLEKINAAALQGFGKELGLSNTEFASGLPAAFRDGVSLRQSGSGVYVQFDKSNVWSLFYTGTLEQTAEKPALAVNRASAQPSPSHSPAVTPQPTPSPNVTPQPTPAPEEPPKTGDAAGFYLLSFTLSAFALSVLVRRFRLL